MKHVIFWLVISWTFLSAHSASAETRSDVYNGATCEPYPPFNATNAVPYTHFLYGFRQSAFCHFTIPDDWNASDLSYVLFHGMANSGAGPLRVRLCVYTAIGLTFTCGTERTISDTGTFSTNWVAPPASMPSSPMGAFLTINFPTDKVSTFAYFIPVFSR